MPYIYKTGTNQYKRFSEDAWENFTVPSPVPTDKIVEVLTKEQLSKFNSTDTKYDEVCKNDAQTHILDIGPNIEEITG